MTIEHPSFGKLDDNRIIIFDTTLRDGEQSPGFSMNLNEKIRMAEALTELGVDVLEAGFAIASSLARLLIKSSARPSEKYSWFFLRAQVHKRKDGDRGRNA